MDGQNRRAAGKSDGSGTGLFTPPKRTSFSRWERTLKNSCVWGSSGHCFLLYGPGGQDYCNVYLRILKTYKNTLEHNSPWMPIENRWIDYFQVFVGVVDFVVVWFLVFFGCFFFNVIVTHACSLKQRTPLPCLWVTSKSYLWHQCCLSRAVFNTFTKNWVCFWATTPHPPKSSLDILGTVDKFNIWKAKFSIERRQNGSYAWTHSSVPPLLKITHVKYIRYKRILQSEVKYKFRLDDRIALCECS